MPALVKVWLNVPPLGDRGVLMPESNVVPSSLVTVCGALVVLVQVTVVPTLMVRVAGLNAKVPLLVIETAIVEPEDVAVGVFPACVGVAVVPVLVVPPHAASTTIAANASRTNHARPPRHLD